MLLVMTSKKYSNTELVGTLGELEVTILLQILEWTVTYSHICYVRLIQERQGREVHTATI